MRLFVEVPISGDFIAEAERIQERLRRSRADVKWVAPENMHFTLCFLGETSQEKLAEVKTALDCAKICSRFEMETGDIGAFPSLESPGVLWLGIARGGEKLCELANSINEAFALIGFPEDKRPFCPHLTLGRVRSGSGRKDLVCALKSSAGINAVVMEVNAVRLMKSSLTPRGPIYECLHQVPLL